MPIRIYELAKKLKVENKVLVDNCVKAGITGKGSALASLTDEEAAKLETYMSASAGPKPVERGFARPSSIAAPKLPDLPKAPPVVSRPPAVELPPKEESPPLRSEPAALPPAPVGSPLSARLSPGSSPAAAPAASSPKSATSPPPISPLTSKMPLGGKPPSTGGKPEPSTYSREDYMAAGGKGKIRVLDSKGKKGGAESKKAGDSDAGKSATRRDPVISLPPLPEIKQPTAGARSDEPKAQKPIIKLPADAIRGHKRGVPAPLEHLTAKADKKGKLGDGKKKTGEPGAPETLSKTSSRDRRKTKTPGEGEGLDSLAGARATRLKDRKSRPQIGLGDEDEGRGGRRGRKPARPGKNVSTAPRKGKATLALPCTVRSFSEASGVPMGRVIKALMGIGPTLTINQQIESEYIDLLAAELGVEIEIKQAESLEDTLMARTASEDTNEVELEPRPPIVTFLGHVDHGKTSLLDRIIGTNVVAGEAGGITQHIRAYSIETKDGRRIGFVDTPGHEAFTEMRARGANVTDVAVLVVAADDGIMPQTEEAISHAKAAKVPIVVALNKMDLPGANAERVLQQLAAQDLLPSEWGGNVEVMRTSAITGAGMDELLETLLLTAELNNYRANPNRPAVGTCLEAEQEGARGVIAKLMVQSGTLRPGDVIVCGSAHGRIKAMHDTLRPHVRLKEAGPSMPVNVTGLDIAPAAGDKFHVVKDIAQAREIATQRAIKSREQTLSGSTTKVSLEKFRSLVEEGKLGMAEEVVTLNLIIRADTRGSIEAIQKELAKLEHPEVQVKVLQASVGGITAADVTLADASQAVIIGFNVIPDEAARSLAEAQQVQIRRYDIIYKVTDDIKATLEGKLKPEERIVDLGHALVKQVFTISRVGAIAGCYVAQGTVERNCRVRVNREGRTIGDYALESLKREKDDAKEVSRGMECGIKLAGFNDIKIGDILEAYKIEEVARTL